MLEEFFQKIMSIRAKYILFFIQYMINIPSMPSGILYEHFLILN